MESKYQEALNKIRILEILAKGREEYVRKLEQENAELKEIIKNNFVKPTPSGLKRTEWYCGKCGDLLIRLSGCKDNYCPNCGVKIDWSDKK